MPLFNKVINADGTICNPPTNPLINKYPPIPDGTTVCDGYSCMWCGRCPMGEYWKVPEEDRDTYEGYVKELDSYIREHNGSAGILGLTLVIGQNE